MITFANFPAFIYVTGKNLKQNEHEQVGKSVTKHSLLKLTFDKDKNLQSLNHPSDVPESFPER